MADDAVLVEAGLVGSDPGTPRTGAAAAEACRPTGRAGREPGRGPGRGRRVASWVLLVIAMLVTLEGGVVLTACWWDDIAINNHLTRTTAVVESVTFNRTVIRFTSPEGVEYRPSQGVLYPRGLEEGQMVRIEYDADNPELARVAGRTAALALLPVGTTLLGVWLVAGALLWWLRRPGMPRTARAAQTP